ncbi:MAG: redoxin domain-containing protein, partial [Myxococcales bacterium]|nr:redoxin domain-containing protein [Myxococcales bacterium]
MPTLRTRSLLPLLFPLTVACSTELAGGDATPQPPGQAGAAPEASADVAAVEVDDRPPVPLDQWRDVKKEGEAAARVADLEQRIEKCRAFVKAHPEHQATADVLESLSDALIEKGGFDPAELAGCLEAKAELEDESSLPTELVERYHLKHDLPTESGLRLLALSRERLDQDEKELALESDERRREWMELRIAYQRAKTHGFEARLHLRDGKVDLAMDALERAQAETTKLAKDIQLRDADGKPVRTMAAGVLEELFVLSAEAHKRKGDEAAAREALSQALGFMNDIEVRRMYDQLRDSLQVGKGDEQEVTAAAQAAQKFELEDLKGKKVKLEDYRGKVVLVTFWATWCGPCKKEMPELQKFQEANKDKGVEVLAINIDDFNSRSKIKPFLDKNNLDVKVLLEKPEQLTDYNYQAIPALYVVDREGKIAHARTGYDPQLKEKLQNEIAAIVESKKGNSGRELLTIEQAPAGWGVRWKQPVNGDVRAVAVASAAKGQPGEVGAVGREGLLRWAADGKALGAKPLAGWTRSLDATDLDGDGKREWIVGGWQDVKVLDHTGELYWEHSGDGMVTVSGHHDLNGDGFQELILQEGDRVVAMKAVPDPMWTSAPFKELEAVHVDPKGGLVVQADGELIELSARGKIESRGKKAPEGRTLSGRIATPDGTVDVYEGKWDPTPVLDHDVDGDGEDDVVVAGRQGLIVYDRQGKPLLRVRSHDVGLTVAVGDLDGKAGDEVVIFVEHY